MKKLCLPFLIYAVVKGQSLASYVNFSRLSKASAFYIMIDIASRFYTVVLLYMF